MATSLAEIRAKLQAQDTRGQGGNSQSGGDNAIYPHWNIAEGSSTRLRFLPDGNSSNDFFWAERLMIRLPFAGVKGQADSKPVIVQVPCVEMYKEACPILAEVRGWFKDPSLEDMVVSIGRSVLTCSKALCEKMLLLMTKPLTILFVGL